MNKNVKRIIKIAAILALIMILLSTFAPKASFAADDDEPNYDGLPAGGKFGVINITGWLIDTLKAIFDWFIGIMTYIIKAVFLGWASIIELAITGLVSLGAATTQEGSLTIEKIVTNQVPILDVNFFNFAQAGGRALDTQSVMYVIRQNVAQFYYIIRNVTIGGMLVTLIYIGIRMALSSIAEAKAKYKAMLKGWVEGMVLVFFIHYIMVFIVNANTFFINIIQGSLGSEESLYDTIRSQSYAIQASIGWPATIVYVALIYLLVKFLFIYFRRFANVAILTFLAPIIAINYAIDKIKDGKAQSLSKWLKDYTVNVLTQSVHCLLYFLFIRLAFDMAGQSIYGVVLAIFLISCISKGEAIFKKIFAFEGSKAAGMGGLEGKPWGDFAKKVAIFGMGAKLNNKWIGKVTTPIRKPINAGIGRIRNNIRSNRISNITQSLNLARSTGATSISVNDRIIGRARQRDVGEIIKDGDALGYSTKEMAEMLNAQIEKESSERRANRVSGVKKGFQNAGAILGMATAISTLPNDPILGTKLFNKYRGKYQKTIKGAGSSGNYKGPSSDKIRRSMGTTGMTIGAAVALSNPVLGAAMLFNFARMRGKAVKGYKNTNGSYTAKGANKTKAKGLRNLPKALARGTGRLAVDYLNVSTANMVPLLKQVKNNMSESQKEQLSQRLVSEYTVSNEMLEERITDEYNKLLSMPNVDQQDLDDAIIRARKSVSLPGIEQSVSRASTEHTIQERTDVSNMQLFNESYRSKDVTIDIARTRSLRSSTNGNELVVKANKLTDVESFARAVMDLKQNATTGKTTEVIAEFGGVEFNSSNYTSVEDLVKAVRGDSRVDQNKLKNEPKGTPEEHSDMDLPTIERVIDNISKKETDIDKTEFKQAFIDVVKEQIRRDTGIDISQITDQDVNSVIAKMTADAVQDALAVAGTKNVSIKGNTSANALYKRILTLIEKTKYNKYAIKDLSYDRNQATDLTEKIKRRKGVK